MYYYRPIGINSAKTMADEDRESRKNKDLPNDGIKNVIDVYFSKPEIDILENVFEGKPEQKKTVSWKFIKQTLEMKYFSCHNRKFNRKKTKNWNPAS